MQKAVKSVGAWVDGTVGQWVESKASLWVERMVVHSVVWSVKQKAEYSVDW